MIRNRLRIGRHPRVRRSAHFPRDALDNHPAMVYILHVICIWAIRLPLENALLLRSVAVGL